MKKQVLVLALVLSCILTAGVVACGSLSDDVTTTEIVDASTTTTVAPTTTTTVIPTGPPDTWSTPRPRQTPGPLQDHELVYDPVTDRVLLFGGWSYQFYEGDDWDGEHCNDDKIWAYDSTAETWSEFGSYSGSASSLIYEPTSQKILGLSGLDLIAYDSFVNEWTPLSTSGDIPSGSGPMVYDSVAGRVLALTGGTIFAYDPATNLWEDLRSSGGPSPYRYDDAVYDPETNRVFAFGGGVLWFYDPQINRFTEANMPKLSPKDRVDVQMVYHPGSKLIIVFGGTSSTPPYGYPEYLWSYDPAQDEWTMIRPTRYPHGRDGHAMAYNPKTGDIIMYGGHNREQGREILVFSPGGIEGEYDTQQFSDTWLLSPSE